MIEFRHHPERTLRIEIAEIPTDRWGWIPYSDYAIRALSDGYGQIAVILIKREDDIDWEDDD